MAKITDGSGTTRYCHDRQGRVVRKVQTVLGGTTLTTGTTYDGAGNLVAMTYPSGAIVTYLRNANGQITQVDAKPTAIATQVTIVDDVTYAPFGPITSIKYGNARVQSRLYDQNYGIDAITETGGTGGFIADYGLDAIGNVTSVTERDTLARDFAYDGQDRLKAMTNGGSNVESFEYDATGNRTKKTLAAAVSTYTIATASHRLANVSNQGTRLYDAAGNTTLVNTGAPAIYGYDERGRLRTVTLNATLQRTYKYNGKGERVLRIVEAGTAQSLQFVYDEAGRLLGEYTTAGSRVAEYVWMGDVLVGVLRNHDGSTYQYVETDHLGTPRAIINPVTNAVIWRWDLTTTTFGDHQPANDPDGNAIAYGFNLRYPGQYYDGLEYVYYNYFRDYDSRTGRYLQSDPIGLEGGMNTYGYVLQSPLSSIDPSGLNGLTAVIGSGEAVAGGSSAGGAALSLTAPVSATPVGWAIMAAGVSALGGWHAGKFINDGATGLVLGDALWAAAHPDEELRGATILLMAKGGKQSYANEYTRMCAHMSPDDKCKFLEEQYNSAPNSAERLKIQLAQKAVGCRNKAKRGR